MDSNYQNHLEGQPPLIPPSEHTVFIVEQVPRRIHNNDDIDIFVIYICAIIAFFMPFFGVVYICCFRFSCCGIGIPYPYDPTKQRAIKILILSTVLGFLIEIILGSIFHDDL